MQKRSVFTPSLRFVDVTAAAASFRVAPKSWGAHLKKIIYLKCHAAHLMQMWVWDLRMAVMDFQSTRVAIFWQRKPSDSEAEDILDVFLLV